MRISRHGEARTDKAGLRPRESFFRRIRKHHPRIRIAWSQEVGEWLVIQRVPGGWHLVFSAGPIPSEVQVMKKLNAGRMGAMSLDQLEAFEDRIDARRDALEQAARAAASEKYQEGADRIYTALGRETRVAF